MTGDPGAEPVVTGVGAVTCFGYGAGTLWEAMGAAAARGPDRPADPLARMALPLIHLVPDGGGEADRAARFALAAADEALRDAGLTAAPDAAVVVGSCMGEVAASERGRGATGAAWDPAFRLAAAVGDRLGATGPNLSVANACAAGTFAVSAAADLVRAGEADLVIAGGSDGYSRIALGCFNRLGAVDPVRCRPFDRHRAGTIFGEGAGMLVLESRARAESRGAAVLARIGGAGWSCDAHHPTAPEPGGAQVARAAREALGDGGAPDCVIPHGTGTRLNDVLEAGALRDVIGPGLDRVPLYSLKALIGHTGGASAAIAACAAVLMLRSGTVPPNVPLDEQDPECPVWLPQSGPEPLTGPGRRVLVNGYGFGGNNCSVVLEAA
ncbi:beta-ketoacyl-[acyl-carrier-protein] synthase family protein [Actinomadura sp. KC06]|uniref:beta-ketoacyl-[acyl-carrier-protein] synthase family protein n=1 Tax=Actinomadura sp. KC06 TaxID=2530369 RepID=UPI00104C60BC|nr:beta-ketoacyl synthase N-terminal-like domain-containing protein [Actinomadura sp. KC06]TDD40135.1 beta-ketoacyl-[acyl-carrier-protein] synthase family protein [Actinomadura sp. KC06]